MNRYPAARLDPGWRHGCTTPGIAMPPKRSVLTLPVEGQQRRMIPQSSGVIVASPRAGRGGEDPYSRAYRPVSSGEAEGIGA